MFKAIHYTQVEAEEVEEGGAKGVSVRWLIKEDDGAGNFAMRLFDVEPAGYTPLHSHSWEHEVFILDGRGLVLCGDSENEVSPGYVVFIPPDTRHCFKNTGESRLRFLCLIPSRR